MKRNKVKLFSQLKVDKCIVLEPDNVKLQVMFNIILLYGGGKKAKKGKDVCYSERIVKMFKVDILS